MSCLYVCSFALASDVRSWTVVKFGVSKYDQPWRRITTHSRTLYNPWGMRIPPRAVACLGFPHIDDARHVEHVIRCMARSCLPRLPRNAPPLQMGLPSTMAPKCNPSGEWILHPMPSYEAIADVLGMCATALAGARDDVSNYDLFSVAYEAFIRASYAWSSGVEYIDIPAGGRCVVEFA